MPAQLRAPIADRPLAALPELPQRRPRCARFLAELLVAQIREVSDHKSEEVARAYTGREAGQDRRLLVLQDLISKAATDASIRPGEQPLPIA